MSNKVFFAVLTIVLIVCAFASLTLGRYGLGAAEIFSSLKSLLFGSPPSNEQAHAVITQIRLPRIAFAVLVGAALSAAGAVYQGLFKNPLVSPDILGVSSGAAVGASIAIILSLPVLYVSLTAFGFGLAAVFAVVFLSQLIARGKLNVIIMVLSGVVISSLFGAFSSLLKFLADSENKLPEITFWLMGSLARTGGYQNVLYMLGVTAFCSVPLFLLRFRLNILAFGEEEAKAMGVNVKFYSFVIICASTLLTASSVAFCGIIGWVGLIVPHIARSIVGANFNALLPASMLIGALFLLVVDTIARCAMASEIPLGIITSLIGAPVFIYLLYQSKKGWL
ncbi:iron ABC transporter permease [uncultured Campylobacter sp.]|uniref:FecCD family ABC transporter permease n=1 Tax=uncultured Campylobacter sp. TaxID=218934 RepID=UPI002633452A|nr:iron ABC transporter permease [uncultured Campylobacter sp.]